MDIIELKVWDTKVLDNEYLVKCFYDEQVKGPLYPGTYSEAVVMERLSNYVFHDEMTSFLLHDDNAAIGFAWLSKNQESCIEYYGILEAFYIHPDARGTGAARILRDAAVEWFDAQDCIYSVCSDQAFIGSDGVFTNLMMKSGYSKLGSTLVRKQNGKSN